MNTWIESTAADVTVEVVIEDEHEDQAFLPGARHPNLRRSWVSPESGNRGSALAKHLRQRHQPEQHHLEGLYARAAGEHSLIKRLRPVPRGHFCLDRSRHFSQSYWIADKMVG